MLLYLIPLSLAKLLHCPFILKIGFETSRGKMSSGTQGFSVLLTVGLLLINALAFSPNHYRYNLDIVSITNPTREQTNVVNKICCKSSNHGTSSRLYSESGDIGKQKILNEDDEDDGLQTDLPKETLYSKSVLDGGASIIDIELKEHKPLGCTVDESLAPQEDNGLPVFVSKASFSILVIYNF